MFLILLTMPCVSISQITALDSLKISPNQVKNVYIGLKQGEVNKQKLSDCITIAKSLDKIIQDQKVSLQSNLVDLRNTNDDLANSNIKLTAAEVKLNELENRKIPFWKHPLMYFVLGLGTGIYIMK